VKEAVIVTTEKIVGWQPQIEIDGKWCGNGYRFERREQALRHAESLAARRAFKGDDIGAVRAVETGDPPNQ
jgi:hypothetical protein